MRNNVRQSIIVLCCLSSWACGSQPPSLLHEVKPIRGINVNALEHIEVTDAELYDESFKKKHGHDGFLSENDPTSIMVEGWVDTMHEALLQRYPDVGFEGIPKPRVRIMLSPAINAFVSSSTVCLRVPIIFNGYSENMPISDSLVLMNAKGEIALHSIDRTACLNRMQQQTSSRDLIRHLVESVYLDRSCEVSTRSDAVVIGEKCKFPQNMQVKGASGIILNLQTNRITLSTGLVNLFADQPELLLVSLLHELAHYYRAHGALLKKSYSYFYRLSDTNFTQDFPSRDPSLDMLGEKLRALPRYRTQPITGQKYHSEMYSYLASTVNLLLVPKMEKMENNTDQSCLSLIHFVRNSSSGLGNFPQENLRGAALSLYFEYESLVDRCMGSIGIAANLDINRTAIMSFDEVKKFLWASSLTEKSTTLLDAWSSMNMMIWNKEVMQTSLLQSALDENIGYYTTEEEADNLSLDWFMLSGKSPHLILQHWLAIADSKRDREQDSAFNFSYERCHALFTMHPRWHENGVKVKIPVGSYADYHHSSCFRIYHISERLRTRFGVQ